MGKNIILVVFPFLQSFLKYLSECSGHPNFLRLQALTDLLTPAVLAWGWIPATCTSNLPQCIIPQPQSITVCVGAKNTNQLKLLFPGYDFANGSYDRFVLIRQFNFLFHSKYFDLFIIIFGTLSRWLNKSLISQININLTCNWKINSQLILVSRNKLFMNRKIIRI